MKLVILFLQVAVVESFRKVSGFVGDDVTLTSGAQPSWTLSSIEWSIFSNNTWIATFRSGRENTERVDRYKGRLSLNITSGDLTIHNLTTKDAMEYTVDLINTERHNSGDKIQLAVSQRLQPPTIQTFPCRPEGGGFMLILFCTSGDKSVEVSWNEAPNATVFNSNRSDAASAMLKVFLSSAQSDVEFSCSSSKNTETAESRVTPRCGVSPKATDETPHTPPDSRARNSAALFFGGVAAGVLVVMIVLFRGKIKSACEHIIGKLRPSKENVTQNVTV